MIVKVLTLKDNLLYSVSYGALSFKEFSFCAALLFNSTMHMPW